ncbi:hypothetical protein OCU04_011583 [Sclerotinia nivalis]|uniref:Uncharacterized protein n=1 Tax=Sclerotinia nivalis TaxID=352851 RepID=A0A9X0AC16_9HELO|nr:hypothetical protein OCU04_011583 [Sclerotinia nivalis]
MSEGDCAGYLPCVLGVGIPSFLANLSLVKSSRRSLKNSNMHALPCKSNHRIHTTTWKHQPQLPNIPSTPPSCPSLALSHYRHGESSKAGIMYSPGVFPNTVDFRAVPSHTRLILNNPEVR